VLWNGGWADVESDFCATSLLKFGNNRAENGLFVTIRRNWA
jgi:hypothetical protein